MIDETDNAAENPLGPILGEQLSAVGFVMDYVQLRFTAPQVTLTANSLPSVTVRGSELTFGMPGYRDMLCQRIGKTVRATWVTEGQEIRIEFDDGSSLSISLKPEDYPGAEAAVLHEGNIATRVWN